MRSLDDGVTHEAPALIVTTRAMRGNIKADKDVKGQEEYSSDEDPNLSYFDRVAKVARRANKKLKKENAILQDGER